MNEEFEPTAAQQLASELQHHGRSQYIGLLFPVPTRLNLDVYSMVEALTHRAGTSRNKLMNQLIEAGIEAVLKELDNDVVTEIREKANDIANFALEKNTGLMERGEM